MRSSSVLNFQQSVVSNLRRPWQTFRDGQGWYGMTKRGSKRHPLTGKQGNKHYYKGTGSSGYGKLNSKGVYIMDWTKVLQTFSGYKDGFKDPELAWHNIKQFIEYGENYNDKDLEKTLFLEEHIHPDIIAAEQEQNTVS